MLKNNPLFNMFGGFVNFQRSFNSFAQQFNNQGSQNPQQVVQNLLNNGQMTQDQFNQIRDIANAITGQRK